MADRAGFLAALRAAPDDEALRLIFADWLDEQGDPLGAFIRLQIELEPLRHDYDQPRAEELRRREQQMLTEHGPAWLGPLHELIGDKFAPVFRRGFVEAAAMPVDVFRDRTDDLAAWCPLLREATFFEVRGQGATLALSPGLQGLERIELADWIHLFDSNELAFSPYLGGLRSIRLWIGSEQDQPAFAALAGSKVLRELKEVELLQLRGGVSAREQAAALNERADSLARMIDGVRGTKIAHVLRPFERTFPMRGKVGHDIYAGRLAGDRPAVLVSLDDEPLLFFLFDQHGNFVEDRRVGLADFHMEQPPPSFSRSQEDELLDYCKQEVGFELGLIRVKEFRHPEDFIVYWLPRFYDDIAADPDSRPRDNFGEEARRAMPRLIYDWIQRRNFVIEWGNDYWADDQGTIHSS
jgi:uncharacterized protein (TIGR02996 family)